MSNVIWSIFETHNISGDVQVFKYIHLVHRILQEGHPSMLMSTARRVNRLQNKAQSVEGEGRNGYGGLAREYASYLAMRCRFYKLYPEFDGMSYFLIILENLEESVLINCRSLQDAAKNSSDHGRAIRDHNGLDGSSRQDPRFLSKDFSRLVT